VIGILVIVLGGAFMIGGVYWLGARPGTQKQAVSQTAYNNYVRAKVLVATENKEDDQQAIDLLEQAVNEAPQYAAAWATLARAYNVKSFFFSSPDERKHLNDNAKIAVEKALAIDPNLAEAHLARGVLLWTHASRFQHEQAAQSYKRALELDPKLDEAHHQLALIYFHIGLFDKAEAEIGRALEINPANSLARYRYAVINMYRGRYEDAYNISKSTPPDMTPPLQQSQSAMILFRLGHIDEAERTVEAYLAQYPQDQGGIVSSVKAMILAKHARAEDALAAVKQAENLERILATFTIPRTTSPVFTPCSVNRTKPSIICRSRRMTGSRAIRCSNVMSC
jgi:tetratricopeptide (TPR) repeat protein